MQNAVYLRTRMLTVPAQLQSPESGAIGDSGVGGGFNYHYDRFICKVPVYYSQIDASNSSIRRRSSAIESCYGRTDMEGERNGVCCHDSNSNCQRNVAYRCLLFSSLPDAHGHSSSTHPREQIDAIQSSIAVCYTYALLETIATNWTVISAYFSMSMLSTHDVSLPHAVFVFQQDSESQIILSRKIYFITSLY